jgi:ribosomal-protein-alanine N-acetyltransferase
MTTLAAFDQVQLKTARLLLRPLAEADAPALFAIFSDPVVMRYWSTPPWASMDEAHALQATTCGWAWYKPKPVC